MGAVSRWMSWRTERVWCRTPARACWPRRPTGSVSPSELAFAAALIYLPPLHSLFNTTALGGPELALLTTFPVIVWGSDELRRAGQRHVTCLGSNRSKASA